MSAEVLLAGSVGALAVFVLGVVREWWRNERERRGILRLLLVEIGHNAEVCRTIGETTWDLLSAPELTSMRVGTWSDCRVRAAQLLPEYLTQGLNDYYDSLQNLLTLLTFPNKGEERMGREIKRDFVEKTGKQVTGSGKQITGFRNPWNDYLGMTLDAQERTRGLIETYLDRTWTDNLLASAVLWLERQQRRPPAAWTARGGDHDLRDRSLKLRRLLRR